MDVQVDSPTAHKETLRMAYSLAATNGWRIKLGDVKSAFLQGKYLTREVLVKPPPKANVKGFLWRIKKGIYGLLDAAKLFYLQLCDILKSLGMEMLKADEASFILHKNSKLIGMVLVHADHMMFLGNTHFHTTITKELQKKLEFSKI